MKRAFLIHGTFGSPEENWFPWLKKALVSLGYEVIIPSFPTPDDQSITSWNTAFEPYVSLVDHDSIFVGHSLGPAFILHQLENLNHPIKAGYFVSGFVELLDNPTFDHLNKSFVETNFKWEKIIKNCPKFKLYHADNDPYVPLLKAKKLAQNLKTNLEIIPNAGHFNQDSGYLKFDKLLQDIKTLRT